MAIHQCDGPVLARLVHGGDGIGHGNGFASLSEFVRLDVQLADPGFQLVGIHRHGMEMRAFDDALGVHEERSPRIHDRGDVGHPHIVRVTKAGIEERGGKQRVGHRVLRRDVGLRPGRDQFGDLGVGIVLHRFSGNPG